MGIFGKQKIRASEFGEALALALFNWWKDEGKTIFNSAIDRAKVKATKKKGAEEALVLGMFAVTWACQNHIEEASLAPSVLDSFHRALFRVLIQNEIITSRKPTPNLTLDASVVAGEFEEEVVRPRYESYYSAFRHSGDPGIAVMRLGQVAKKAIAAAQEGDPAFADLRFANVVTAVLDVMKQTIVDLQKDNQVVA